MKINKTIEVGNCKECLFCNYYLVYSIDFCKLNNSIEINKHSELPEDKVHEDCPLKNNDYKIKLK